MKLDQMAWSKHIESCHGSTIQKLVSIGNTIYRLYQLGFGFHSPRDLGCIWM